MADMIELSQINDRIVIDVRYATTNNFTGVAVYDTPRVFLQSEVAKKVSDAQERLEKRGLGLKVFDGYRPHSVQRVFWEHLPDARYVADPEAGSPHNRGAAVDLTIIDLKSGKEVPMPTEFDEMTERAHRDYFDLPQEVIDNRALLEEVMVGFIPYQNEWWHFTDENWSDYAILDIPIGDLVRCMR